MRICENLTGYGKVTTCSTYSSDYLRKWIVFLLTCIYKYTQGTVTCEFVLTVNLVNYTNPTGLCAECQRQLNTSYPTETIPVCCDELPYTFGNCDNTGEERCDTRFRWTIRPFGASLETRPVTIYPIPLHFHITSLTVACQKVFAHSVKWVQHSDKAKLVFSG